MKRRHLLPVISGVVFAGIRGPNEAIGAGANARDATLAQCATDIAACRQMLVQLLEIQNVTQVQAADNHPVIASAGGGAIRVGGIEQCQTNSQN